MTASLQFRKDGSFTIAQFTDIHWHNGEESDQQSRRLMESVLEIEKPDLAVLTGDVLAGSGCHNPAESWRQCVAPLETRGIPWSAVFGNHDDEGALSRYDLMQVQQSCAHCLSEPGPDDISGVGNYVLRLFSAHDGELAAALYFLDSLSYATTDIGGYGWITREQIGWYLGMSELLGAAYAMSRANDPGYPNRLPALAFFHIPLPEYNEVWDTRTCYGVKYEDVCCPKINTGMFAAMHEAGDVRGVFVGHDHVNDYIGDLHGIQLAYGRASGYATYGREGMPRGARVIQLREGERDFQTWLRLEDGSRIDSQPEHISS